MCYKGRGGAGILEVAMQRLLDVDPQEVWLAYNTLCCARTSNLASPSVGMRMVCADWCCLVDDEDRCLVMDRRLCLPSPEMSYSGVHN